MKRISWYLKIFGFQGVFLAIFAAMFKKPIRLNIYCGLLHKWISVRTKTSDLAVYEKVIKNEEYALPVNIHPKVIVDLGANIGLSTLYFSAKYPDAKLIAVEPEDSNFRMLQDNTKGSANIHSVKAAIWKEPLPIHIAGNINSDFHVSLQGGGVPVEGITFEELMNRYSVNYVDILKIDIEGAEKEMFENSHLWIDKVGLIVIELHDRLRSGCSEVVLNATKSFEAKFESGENTFFMREKCE